MTDGSILLACAWTTDIARRKFDMYPEYIGGDNTEDINAKDRPLYIIVGLDNENKSFEVLWAFLPSEAQWAYSWLWKYVMPILHPGTAQSRVIGINCDTDPQETRAIEGVSKHSVGLGVPVTFSQAQNGWCTWH